MKKAPMGPPNSYRLVRARGFSFSPAMFDLASAVIFSTLLLETCFCTQTTKISTYIYIYISVSLCIKSMNNNKHSCIIVYVLVSVYYETFSGNNLQGLSDSTILFDHSFQLKLKPTVIIIHTENSQ